MYGDLRLVAVGQRYIKIALHIIVASCIGYTLIFLIDCGG